LRLELGTLRTADQSNTLLTKAEAADQLNVSERTVDTLIACGDLQPVRIRGCVRIHPKTLRAFIRRNAEGGRN
jgi:excisionase family DNA binding protein